MPSRPRGRLSTSQHLLVVGVFAVIVVAGLTMAYDHRADQGEQARRVNGVVADQVRHRIQGWVRARLTVLAHLASESGVGEAASPDLFAEHASALHERIEGVQALNWVDAGGVIRIVIPRQGNEAALGKDLHEHPSQSVPTALRKAARSGSLARTSVIELYQGKIGFAVYSPVLDEHGQIAGYLNGVFRVKDLVTHCLDDSWIHDRYQFTLTEADGQPAYIHPDPSGDEPIDPVELQVEVADRPWLLRLAPTRAHLAETRDTDEWFVVGGSLALALALAGLLLSTFQRQATTRASEEHVRLLLDSTVEGIYGVDTEGTCTFCNPAAVKLLGYDEPEDLLGRNMHALIHHSARDGVPQPEEECRILAACLEGEPTHGEAETLWRRDGSRIEALYRAHQIRQGGRVVGVVVTFSDVTGRRRAEAERERLSAIVEETSDLVGIADARGRPIYLNRTGRELLCVGPDGDLGRNVLGLWSGAERQRMVEVALPAAIATGVWAGETVLRARDGEAIEVSQVLMAHKDARGDVSFFSAIARDITAQKREQEKRTVLEHQFQQAQKLESLGLLAGGIAHDFNNLLVGILGNASLLLSRLPANAEGRGAVRAIETASERAAELTRQLLAYSGRGQFVVQAVDLAALVREMLDLLRVSLSKKVQFEHDFPEDVPTVEGDASQIRQVVMNLITNAADSVGDREGTVRVRVGSVLVRGVEPGEILLHENLVPGPYATIEVSDTGEGMDEETRARIFDPFFTTKPTGRGLGLSAVLGIVGTHGGAVRLDSTPGVGTTFTVFLPVSESTVEISRPIPQPERRETAAGLVLVVDDEEMVRELVSECLADHGYTAITARDGFAGVGQFRERADDIVAVVLDMTMPGMSGEEVYRAIRETDREVAVLLSSGYDEQQVAACLVGDDHAAFLQKPYRVSELAVQIRDLVEGRVPA